MVERPGATSTSRSSRRHCRAPKDAYPDDVWTQLKAVRSMVDPDGVFAANHQIPRLYENGAVTE